MIFQPVLCCKVLAGEKHSTRRPAPAGRSTVYSAGNTYAIQPGRGRSSIASARIRVTEHVARITIGHLSDEGVFREGFHTREAFERYWTELHGSYDPKLKVWLIHFELTTPPNTCPRCSAPVEWVLSPDEKNVLALDRERTDDGTILVSMRRVNMAGTAVPQTPEEIGELRKQAASRDGEDVRLFNEHRCTRA